MARTHGTGQGVAYVIGLHARGQFGPEVMCDGPVRHEI